MTIQIVAHRGFSSERPENTTASFDHAIESGFPFIELDIHSTSDGIPIVMHDSTVDRTTDGAGHLSSLTFSAIQELDAGSWFISTCGQQFPRQKIPSLEDILMRYVRRAHIFIEIKSPEKALIDTSRNLLSKHGWLEKATGPFQGIQSASIISFNREQLVHSRSIIPELAHGFLTINIDENTIAFCVENRFQGIFPRFNALTQNVVNKAREANLFVGTWGVSKPEDLEIAMDLGIAGVTVDWPTAASNVLSRVS